MILSKALEGSVYTVAGIDGGDFMRRRLMDLGLTEGASVSPLFSGLGGGIRAYSLRGAVIALRDEDAKLIMVEGPEKNGADRSMAGSLYLR